MITLDIATNYLDIRWCDSVVFSTTWFTATFQIVAWTAGGL